MNPDPRGSEHATFDAPRLSAASWARLIAPSFLTGIGLGSIAIFLPRMRGMERPAAEKAYAVLTDAKGGIYRDLKINPEGVKTVMALRSSYAEPKKTLNDPSRYVDETYLSEASK